MFSFLQELIKDIIESSTENNKYLYIEAEQQTSVNDHTKYKPTSEYGLLICKMAANNKTSPEPEG